MTRTQIARQLKKLDITTARDAVAAGVAALKRIEAEGIHKVGKLDRVTAALLYSEFMAESTDDTDLWVASENAAWMRQKLGLDCSGIVHAAEQVGYYGAGT